MKYLKFLLFIFIFIFSFNVQAQEIDVTDYCYGTTGYARMYDGTEVTYGNSSLFNFGTTYQFQLSSFQTDLRYNFQPNTWYLISFIAADNDFRNNFSIWRAYDLDNNSNDIVSGFSFIDKRKVLISFTTTTATTKVRLVLGSSNISIPITGEVNWNIQQVLMDDPHYGESGSGGSGDSSSNQDIINNQNQNTQDIINNQNSTTQEIIENQNENTDKEIESQSVCTYYDKINATFPGMVGSGGVITNTTSQNFGVTDFISINSNTEITILQVIQQNLNIGFYDTNKNFLSLFDPYNSSVDDLISIPLNAHYVRFTINKSANKPQYKICKNGNQAISDAITDDTVDSNLGSSFFDNFTSEDFGLSQIITIPLNTIQSLTSKTCSPLILPIPFTNSNISLPCMTLIYESKLPTIYNLWKIVSFGIVAYFIAIDIFHIVKGFKDPESDKVEVLDL